MHLSPQVTITPLVLDLSHQSDIHLLRDKWLLLESNTPSPFLRWQWIDSWLTTLPKETSVWLITASQDEKTLGLGLVCEQISLLPHKPQQLFIHKAGSQRSDQIWIEHNDFLMASEHAAQIRESMLKALLSHFKRWQQLTLGMSTTQTLDAIGDALKQHTEILQEEKIISAAYRCNLSDFHTPEDYLTSLSRNTRAQIKRSEKLLSEGQTVTLDYAQGKEQKRHYFEQVALLHKQRWADTAEGSGFNNPLFTQFHKKLIFEDKTNQFTRMYCLKAGGAPLAYAYLLTTEQGWYFYLSAMQFSQDNRIKVGLLLHCKIIQQAIAEGVPLYDFLAGDARYKASLSNNKYTQAQYTFYKKSLVSNMILKTKALKAKLKSDTA